MVRVPENNSNVTICLRANVGIPEDLEVEVTASAKGTPGSASEQSTLLLLPQRCPELSGVEVMVLVVNKSGVKTSIKTNWASTGWY